MLQHKANINFEKGTIILFSGSAKANLEFPGLTS